MVILPIEGHLHASLACKCLNKLHFKVEVNPGKQRSPRDISSYQKCTVWPEWLWHMSAGDAIIVLQFFFALEQVTGAKIFWEACIKSCQRNYAKREGCVWGGSLREKLDCLFNWRTGALLDSGEQAVLKQISSLLGNDFQGTTCLLVLWSLHCRNKYA